MTIKIYKPTKSSMQSGLGKTKKWLAEYIIETDKVKDTLMGWNSSTDTKEQIKMFFDTKEQAVNWAIKNKYQYFAFNSLKTTIYAIFHCFTFWVRFYQMKKIILSLQSQKSKPLITG